MWALGAGDEGILQLENAATLTSTSPAGPIVALGASATLTVQLFDSSPGTWSSNVFSGPGSSVIAIQHNGEFVAPPAMADFSGTFLNLPLGMAGGSGPTSMRPLTDIPIGCLYDDTTLGELIQWNGAAWVAVGGAGSPQSRLVSGTFTQYWKLNEAQGVTPWVNSGTDGAASDLLATGGAIPFPLAGQGILDGAIFFAQGTQETQWGQTAPGAQTPFGGVFSADMWIKIDTGIGSGTMVHARDTGTSQLQILLMNGHVEALLSVSGVTQTITSPSLGGVQVNAWDPQPGVWQHVCAVCDGTNWNLYQDGGLVATVAFALTPVPGTGQFAVGNSLAATDQFPGWISQVRVWPIALTAANVEEVWRRGVNWQTTAPAPL
jgi:hypothetical protein